MSDSKNQTALPSLVDATIILVALGLITMVIFNTIRINSLKKEADLTMPHVCFLTEMVFGPVPPEAKVEACNTLREKLQESWEASESSIIDKVLHGLQ